MGTLNERYVLAFANISKIQSKRNTSFLGYIGPVLFIVYIMCTPIFRT